MTFAMFVGLDRHKRYITACALAPDDTLFGEVRREQTPLGLSAMLRREGHRVNHNKVLRVYREEGLAVSRRRRTKCIAVARVPLPQPTRRTGRWSMDFVSDALTDGRAFHC